MRKEKIKELEDQLAKLKKEDALESRPKVIKVPNINELKEVCQTYIDRIADGEYCCDDDDKHWIVEAALKCLFGKDIYKYINSKL